MGEGITMDDPHSEFFPAHFLPDRIGGVLLLLEAVEGDLDKLSPYQIARIKEILFLDDPRTVQELVEQGIIHVSVADRVREEIQP